MTARTGPEGRRRRRSEADPSVHKLTFRRSSLYCLRVFVCVSRYDVQKIEEVLYDMKVRGLGSDSTATAAAAAAADTKTLAAGGADVSMQA